MRIGVDARPLGKQRTGVGNYVEGLLQHLPKLTPDHEYFLYSNRELSGFRPNGNFSTRIDDKYRPVPGAFWLAMRGGLLARRDSVEVFWSTYPMLPSNLPAGVFKIVNVYDLVWLRYPETTSRYNLFVQSIWTQKAIDQADRIIVISRTVRDELVERLHVPAEKISLVYPGIGVQYQPQDRGVAAQYISEKYSVPARYMATVCSIEPRKNLKLLVEVLRILKSRNKLSFPLLVAGGSGWKNSDLFRRVKSAGLTSSEVVFLGYLSDIDLPRFYAGAQLFLFPTLYEGFGLPPLEAMASGTPVVASDAPCMPEVLGNAAILRSPGSAEIFADAVLMVLEDEGLRQRLRSAGIVQSQNYRWERSAMALKNVFEEYRSGLVGQNRFVK